MFKTKIIIKKYTFDPSGVEAEELNASIREIVEEADKLEGCDGVYYELDFYDPYDDHAHQHCWVFYRYETDEEFALRKKKAEQAQLNYKRSQYEKLKKELGL